eukprot:jgi/Chrzof1/8825/Cz03g25270.t1
MILQTRMCSGSPCRGLSPGHPRGLVTPRPSGVMYMDLFTVGGLPIAHALASPITTGGRVHHSPEVHA